MLRALAGIDVFKICLLGSELLIPRVSLLGQFHKDCNEQTTQIMPRVFVNTHLLVHKHVKISVDEWILETTCPQKHAKFLALDLSHIWALLRSHLHTSYTEGVDE